MPSLLQYCPPPNRAKVAVWLGLPVLYFMLPDEGIVLGGYTVSRLVAAVSLHLPAMMIVSLINFVRKQAGRDRLVLSSIVALSMLFVVNVVAILVATDSVPAAKHLLSLQAAAFIAFHLWALSYPDFLRDFYAWPWAGLPKGIGVAGVIRGLGHALVLFANETLIRFASDAFWVIAAALLPVLAVILADAVTVYVLYVIGLRPRGHPDAPEAPPEADDEADDD